MRVVFEIIGPVFLIIALGYVAARRGLVAEAGFRGLTSFAFNLAVPSLLFLGGVTGPGLFDRGGGGAAALAFFLGAGSLYAGTLWAGRRVLGLRLGEAGLFALDASFGNTVILGVPLVIAAFGPQAVAVLLAILALHSMLLLGTATVVAEIGLHAAAPWWRVLRATLLGVGRSPIVMAVFCAMAWRLLGLPAPPAVLRHTMELLGAAGPPVALFCLGGGLVSFNARAAWRETAIATVLKLMVLPLLVWLAARALALPPLETAVTVLVAALPTGANAFLLAQRYRLGPDRSGGTVLVSTTLSVLTLALLLAWLKA